MIDVEITRSAGIAVWRQIQAALEKDIAGERLAGGSRLPTEGELARRFGVNRHTVRRALAAMQAKGLLRIEQGRGTFVRETVVHYPLGRRVRFSESLLKLRRNPARRTLFSRVVEGDEAICRELHLRPGSSLLHIEGLGEADGQPLDVSSSYFPAQRFCGLDQIYRETGSVTASFKRMGLADYTRKITRVTARMPSAEDARLLDQPRNRPVLVVESVNMDVNGIPVQYGLTRWASDRVQLVIEPEDLTDGR